jgi:hypothetical protein
LDDSAVGGATSISRLYGSYPSENTCHDAAAFIEIVDMLRRRANVLGLSVNDTLFGITPGTAVEPGILTILRNEILRIAKLFVDMSVDYDAANYTNFPIYLVEERALTMFPGLQTVPEWSPIFDSNTTREIAAFLKDAKNCLEACYVVDERVGLTSRALGYVSRDCEAISTSHPGEGYESPELSYDHMDVHVNRYPISRSAEFQYDDQNKDPDKCVISNDSEFPCTVEMRFIGGYEDSQEYYDAIFDPYTGVILPNPNDTYAVAGNSHGFGAITSTAKAHAYGKWKINKTRRTYSICCSGNDHCAIRVDTFQGDYPVFTFEKLENRAQDACGGENRTYTVPIDKVENNFIRESRRQAMSKQYDEEYYVDDTVANPCPYQTVSCPSGPCCTRKSLTGKRMLPDPSQDPGMRDYFPNIAICSCIRLKHVSACSGTPDQSDAYSAGYEFSDGTAVWFGMNGSRAPMELTVWGPAKDDAISLISEDETKMTFTKQFLRRYSRSDEFNIPDRCKNKNSAYESTDRYENVETWFSIFDNDRDPLSTHTYERVQLVPVFKILEDTRKNFGLLGPHSCKEIEAENVYEHDLVEYVNNTIDTILPNSPIGEKYGRSADGYDVSATTARAKCEAYATGVCLFIKSYTFND